MKLYKNLLLATVTRTIVTLLSVDLSRMKKIFVIKL